MRAKAQSWSNKSIADKIEEMPIIIVRSNNLIDSLVGLNDSSIVIVYVNYKYTNEYIEKALSNSVVIFIGLYKNNTRLSTLEIPVDFKIINDLGI